MEPTPSTLRDRARRLRRNQTEAERKLWAQLRFRQLSNAKFRRQYPIGRFITDFCCMEHHLVVELDGGQHAVQIEADQRRTAFLARCGYRVIRFWDHEVLQNIEAVLQQIMEVLKNPHPNPLPKGEGKRFPLKERGKKSSADCRPPLTLTLFQRIATLSRL